jgi:hypothetical protein
LTDTARPRAGRGMLKFALDGLVRGTPILFIAARLRPLSAGEVQPDRTGGSDAAQKKNPAISGVFDRNGQSRNRTGDTWIFSPLLYQLSYLPELEYEGGL